MNRALRGSRNALLALAVAGVWLPGLPGCAADPPPFNPADFQTPEEERAGEVVPREKQPLPTTLQAPDLDAKAAAERAATRPSAAPATGPALGVAESEPVVRLSLREAVQRAVANNLDVKVQSYEPAIEETRVVEEEARFDPAFFTTGQFEQRDDAGAGSSIFGDVGGAEADIYTLRTGVRQQLPFGGQAELRYQTQYNRTLSTEGFPNVSNTTVTSFESELALEITQPLLRDFGGEVNRARIAIQRNNQRISLLEFRGQLEETITEVERTYWQLAQALAEVDIQERLLDDTIGTAQLLIARRGQDVTRVQISQATGAVESRRATLVRARADVRDLSDQLKRLMNDPDLPVTSGTLILPGDEPSTVPLDFDLADAVETALEYRAELGQQLLRIESATIARKVAKQNLLPQLNAVGQVASNGLDNSWGESLSQQNEFDFISYAVGLQLEIPIGNRAARAAFKRSQLQRQQAIWQYASLIDQIALDVKQALRDVETSWEEMVATRRAVYANEDALLAIRQREEAQEPLTPEFVNRKLDQQAQVAVAARAYAASVSSYNFAITRLEAAKGTLLRYNNVVLEEQPLAQFTDAP